MTSYSPDTIALAELEARKRGLRGQPTQQTIQPKSVSLSDFKKAVYSSYVHTNYHALLDAKLEQVARYVETGGREGIGRLMVFMPPRHGKSLSVSKLFPAWFIGRNPDKRMIMASYGESLAKKNSRFVRNLIKSKNYQTLFPHVQLSDDTASAKEWDIANHSGGAMSAGIGGGITGNGANLFIIDDPIKSRAEAESETYRENLKEWYGDAYTRLEEPGAAIVLMHTRWHQDDLAGYLLNDGVDQWEVFNLPAEAGANDPLGRESGAALWPERYSVEKLHKVEEALGEYRYMAEYQQNPTSKSGGLFDTALIDIIEDTPTCKHMVRFYDMAVTKKTTSDYTASIKLGILADETIVILHGWRDQRLAPDVQEQIVHTATLDGKGVSIWLEGEKAGIVQLSYLLNDPRMRGYQIDTIPPIGDKYTRAGPVAKRVKNKKVVMVRGEWNRALLDELAVFPNGKHDDWVDALSGAYDQISNYRTHGGIHF